MVVPGHLLGGGRILWGRVLAVSGSEPAIVRPQQQVNISNKQQLIRMRVFLQRRTVVFQFVRSKPFSRHHRIHAWFSDGVLINHRKPVIISAGCAMRRIFKFALALLVTAAATLTPPAGAAQVETRMALVIGNGAYASGALATAAN